MKVRDSDHKEIFLTKIFLYKGTEKSYDIIGNNADKG